MEEKIVVKIDWADFEVQFKEVYTRGIDLEFSKRLFQSWGVSVEKQTLNPYEIMVAQNYLIEAMTNVPAEKIMDLSDADAKKILERIEKIKNPLKESQA